MARRGARGDGGARRRATTHPGEICRRHDRLSSTDLAPSRERGSGRYFFETGWATTRWHLFTGDALWRRDWSAPSLETACGYVTGPLWPKDHLDIVQLEPDAACRLCLGRAWSKRLADPGS